MSSKADHLSSSENAPVQDTLEMFMQRGLAGMVEAFLDNYFTAHEGILPTAGLYNRIIQEIERPLLQMTLKQVQGNQKKAALILGINRNTLRKKLTDLNIDPTQLT